MIENELEHIEAMAFWSQPPQWILMLFHVKSTWRGSSFQSGIFYIQSMPHIQIGVINHHTPGKPKSHIRYTTYTIRNILSLYSPSLGGNVSQRVHNQPTGNSLVKPYIKIERDVPLPPCYIFSPDWFNQNLNLFNVEQT